MVKGWRWGREIGFEDCQDDWINNQNNWQTLGTKMEPRLWRYNTLVVPCPMTPWKDLLGNINCFAWTMGTRWPRVQSRALFSGSLNPNRLAFFRHESLKLLSFRLGLLRMNSQGFCILWILLVIASIDIFSATASFYSYIVIIIVNCVLMLLSFFVFFLSLFFLHSLYIILLLSLFFL